MCVYVYASWTWFVTPWRCRRRRRCYTHKRYVRHCGRCSRSAVRVVYSIQLAVHTNYTNERGTTRAWSTRTPAGMYIWYNIYISFIFIWSITCSNETNECRDMRKIFAKTAMSTLKCASRLRSCAGAMQLLRTRTRKWPCSALPSVAVQQYRNNKLVSNHERVCVCVCLPTRDALLNRGNMALLKLTRLRCMHTHMRVCTRTSTKRASSVSRRRHIFIQIRYRCLLHTRERIRSFPVHTHACAVSHCCMQNISQHIHIGLRHGSSDNTTKPFKQAEACRRCRREQHRESRRDGVSAWCWRLVAGIWRRVCPHRAFDY